MESPPCSDPCRSSSPPLSPCRRLRRRRTRPSSRATCRSRGERALAGHGAAGALQSRRPALARAGHGPVPDALARRTLEPVGGRGAGGRGPAGRGHGRARPARGWRLGNPWWVGPSDRIEYRLRGRVTRLRAFFVWSPQAGVPAADAAADRRAADRAAERLGRRRDDPAREPLVRDRGAARDRPPHGGHERLQRSPGAGDRAGDPALPREGERLERHRLQLSRRPLRPGLRRPLRRHRPQRRRRARRGLQHRLRRGRRARRVQLAARRPRRHATRSRGCSPGGSTSRTSIRSRRSPSSPAATPASRRACRSSCARSPATATPASPTVPGRRSTSCSNSIGRRGRRARPAEALRADADRGRAGPRALPGPALGAARRGRSRSTTPTAARSRPPTGYGGRGRLDLGCDLAPAAVATPTRSGRRTTVTPAVGLDRRRRARARGHRARRRSRDGLARTTTASPTRRRSPTR